MVRQEFSLVWAVPLSPGPICLAVWIACVFPCFGCLCQPGSALWERVVRDFQILSLVTCTSSMPCCWHCLCFQHSVLYILSLSNQSKELKTSCCAVLGASVPWFWQASQCSLQLQAAPVVWLFSVLSVVFSKNNLWALAEQTWKTFSCHRVQLGTAPESLLLWITGACTLYSYSFCQF